MRKQEKRWRLMQPPPPPFSRLLAFEHLFARGSTNSDFIHVNGRKWEPIIFPPSFPQTETRVSAFSPFLSFSLFPASLMYSQTRKKRKENKIREKKSQEDGERERWRNWVGSHWGKEFSLLPGLTLGSMDQVQFEVWANRRTRLLTWENESGKREEPGVSCGFVG